jgi:flagellar hook assembly protein FlgD
MIWNGKNENGATVPSGAYFLRMEAGDFTSVKKMLFLK